MEIAIKGAEVIAIGLTLLAAAGVGISLFEGDLVIARKAAVSTAFYAIIAGGIIYAEKQLAKKPTPPTS